MIKDFTTFVNENLSPKFLDWSDVEISTGDEEAVSDVVRDTLGTDVLKMIPEESDLFQELSQISSTVEDPEKVLELDDHDLTLFEGPFNFLRWDRIGTDKEPIETVYIVKSEDVDKI
jgi:hypothetical protein